MRNLNELKPILEKCITDFIGEDAKKVAGNVWIEMHLKGITDALKRELLSPEKHSEDLQKQFFAQLKAYSDSESRIQQEFLKTAEQLFKK